MSWTPEVGEYYWVVNKKNGKWRIGRVLHTVNWWGSGDKEIARTNRRFRTQIEAKKRMEEAIKNKEVIQEYDEETFTEYVTRKTPPDTRSVFKRSPQIGGSCYDHFMSYRRSGNCRQG